MKAKAMFNNPHGHHELVNKAIEAGCKNPAVVTNRGCVDGVMYAYCLEFEMNNKKTANAFLVDFYKEVGF